MVRIMPTAMTDKRARIQPNKVLKDWEHVQLQKVMQSKIKGARSTLPRQVRGAGGRGGVVGGGRGGESREPNFPHIT